MSETKFTKGEWDINFTGPHWNNPCLRNIEITHGYVGECICDTVYDINDAYLIKTAPKLYAMLEQIINMQENNYGDANLTHNVLSYLAKEAKDLLAEARGEK